MSKDPTDYDVLPVPYSRDTVWTSRTIPFSNLRVCNYVGWHLPCKVFSAVLFVTVVVVHVIFAVYFVLDSLGELSLNYSVDTHCTCDYTLFR